MCESLKCAMISERYQEMTSLDSTLFEGSRQAKRNMKSTLVVVLKV